MTKGSEEAVHKVRDRNESVSGCGGLRAGQTLMMGRKLCKHQLADCDTWGLSLSSSTPEVSSDPRPSQRACGSMQWDEDTGLTLGEGALLA